MNAIEAGWDVVQYTDIARLQGPLLVVRGIRDVGWDESAVIVLPNGERRHGVVLDVDHDDAVIEVYEGTQGMAPSSTAVRFGGRPFDIPVGTAWLGRVCNGRGEPRDGGPVVRSQRRLAVAGRPLNPSMREPPTEAIITGISAIDALATLVRGQKLP
ncbi:MAG TPA: hypothetical protein VFN80_00430, partial [Acidothermaceae bacterium]|nr:hypothetical protein [Acidothermaceae bacterium]